MRIADRKLRLVRVTFGVPLFLEYGMSDEERIVWLTIELMNGAWTDGRVDDLSRYCHPEIIATTPIHRGCLEGRADYLAAWRRFCQRATIHEWSVMAPKVRIIGEVAVATYESELMCVIDGEMVWLPGQQLLVLVKEGGGWLAIAGQFSEFPSQALSEILVGPDEGPQS